MNDLLGSRCEPSTQKDIQILALTLTLIQLLFIAIRKKFSSSQHWTVLLQIFLISFSPSRNQRKIKKTITTAKIENENLENEPHWNTGRAWQDRGDVMILRRAQSDRRHTTQRGRSQAGTGADNHKWSRGGCRFQTRLPPPSKHEAAIVSRLVRREYQK